MLIVMRSCAHHTGVDDVFPQEDLRRTRLTEPAVNARLTDLGQDIFPPEQQTPEALGTLQKAEIEKWWPLIKEAGIKPE